MKNLEKNIINTKSNSNLNLFILSSKKNKVLNKIEKKINSLNYQNILILNIYSIGINKPIDLSREKLLQTFQQLKLKLK